MAGAPITGDLQQSLPCDLRIAWPGGTELFYNLRFARSRRDRPSYSLPLRPDVVLRRPDGRLCAFDAKFRIRTLTDLSQDLAPDTDDPDPTHQAHERRGIFKQADLYKMHTYRDALGIPSVWILYPGEGFRFFDARGGGGIVRDPQGLEGPLEGVGAIPVRPEEGLGELMAVVGACLGDGEHERDCAGEGR